MTKQIILDLNLNWRDFKFFAELDGENKYCQLTDILPWMELDLLFQTTVKNEGRTPYNSRLVLGLLILQQIGSYTDRKLIELVRENVYYQMFIGMTEFSFKSPVNYSSLVHFRKRIEPITLQINEILLKSFGVLNCDKEDFHEEEVEETHKGDIVIDATVAPVDVRYPTDLKLLDESRVQLEGIIDDEYIVGSEPKKPRTNRNVAKAEFNKISKQKKSSYKKRRKAVKKQLKFVKDDIEIIEKRIENKAFNLNEKNNEKFELIKKVYEQQKYMIDNNTNSVKNRIISLNQNHVRPIVRGKAGRNVEFGAKVSMHIHNGYAYLDKVSFDNFNESTILKKVIEDFKKLHGYYPKRVLGDRIYQTIENKKYCSELGIRLQGKKMGRKNPEIIEEEKILAKMDNGDRQQIEGLFGVLKRKYGMDKLFTKLKQNQMANIGMLVVVRNIEKYLTQNKEKDSQDILSVYFTDLAC